MCSRQNSLGKGGLNAKAKRREFIECDIRKSPFSKPCVFDVDEIMAEIKRDSEVQEELQKCRDDLKKAQETTEKLLQYMKAMGD